MPERRANGAACCNCEKSVHGGLLSSTGPLSQCRMTPARKRLQLD